MTQNQQQKQKQEERTACKLTVSGSYMSHNGEIVNFEDVSGIVPKTDVDLMSQAANKRFIHLWLKEDKRYKKSIKRVRECALDDVEDVKSDDAYSFIGKDVKKLSSYEIQCLALYFNLRPVPLPKSSIRIQRFGAYRELCLREGIEFDADNTESDFVHLPSVAVEDTGVSKSRDITTFSVSSDGGKVESSTRSYSLEELKKEADKRGIKYHPNIGFDKLYKRVHGE